MAISVKAPVIPPRPARHRANPFGQIGVYAALVLVAALFTVPFAWLALTSFKPENQVFAPQLWPHPATTANYAAVFQLEPVLTWLRNSVIVSVLAVACVLLSSSLVAYGFARLRFPGRKALFAIVLATYILPAATTMVPTFLIWEKLGFYGTYVPLFGANLFGSAFYIFMLRQFLLGIPQDVVDAARIDGASFLGIYWRIMLPLIKPALIAVAVFEFQAKWNDFLTPLIYLNRPEQYTMALGLSTLKQAHETQWAMWMAASVIATVPMIVLFFLAQRFFIEGIATTGSKA